MMAAVMPKAQARDLEADLAICEAVKSKLKDTKTAADILATAINFTGYARQGWPYAIRRALEAEREIDRLRNENAMLLEALSQRGCGL